jgi:hypothetical protein
MKQEDRELLLKDLCARLPYGVKVAFFNEDLTHHSESITLIGIECINNLNYSRLEDEDGNTTIVEFVKPYLFPLSNMTEEQKKELKDIIDQTIVLLTTRTRNEDYGIDQGKHHFDHTLELDWLNKNHFDYRGLIEKGLAIDATGLNIY